jgi:hypothetical protein
LPAHDLREGTADYSDNLSAYLAHFAQLIAKTATVKNFAESHVI